MARLLNASRSSDRGVILVYVALILVVLIGVAALVTDEGVFYLARRQAQNAADAGALAGAIARVFDEPAVAGPLTLASATQAAQANPIFGVTPGVDVETATPCPPFAGSGSTCVRVRVYRDGVHATPLPTFLAHVFNQGSQSIQAYGMAQARIANATNCLKPWMIPNVTEVVLKPGNPGDAAQPSFYFEIGNASTYQEAISGCIITAAIGDAIKVLPGNRVGPTRNGTRDLIMADQHATVDSNGHVTGSCAPLGCPSPYQNALVSPRIVAIAIYDAAEYVALGQPSGNFNLHIVNIMAVFVKSVGPPQATVTGVIVGTAGVLSAGPTVDTGASFLRVVTLIQ
jgi:Flp pilus assembly protein TadG